MVKITLTIIVVGISVTNMQAVRCGCGSHSLGIVEFFTDGPLCCGSSATGLGWVDYYEYNEGAWMWHYSDVMEGFKAQDICCP